MLVLISAISIKGECFNHIRVEIVKLDNLKFLVPFENSLKNKAINLAQWYEIIGFFKSFEKFWNNIKKGNFTGFTIFITPEHSSFN